MAYTDEKFPEFADARHHKTGTCLICKAPRGKPHDIRRHDDFDAANDASY